MTNKNNGLLQNLQDARKDGAHFILSLSEISDVIDAMTRAQPQNMDDWIKAEAAKDYEGLLVQFRAMKCLLNSQGEMLSWYANKDYSLSYARLNELNASLESEREMNAELTAEVERLSHPKQEPVGDAKAALDEPKFIKQTSFGDDGNCYSACLASMLGFEIEELPDFKCLSGGKSAALWWIEVRKWAAQYNAQIFNCPPEISRYFVKTSKGFIIVAGHSERELVHAVIYKDGELYFDPHPDNTGIKDITDVDLIVPINPLFPIGKAYREPPDVNKELLAQLNKAEFDLGVEKSNVRLLTELSDAKDECIAELLAALKYAHSQMQPFCDDTIVKQAIAAAEQKGGV